MESVCVCGGKAWRFAIRAHDVGSAEWVGGVFAPDCKPILAGDFWLFQEPCAVATEQDPLIEIDLRVSAPPARTTFASGARGIAAARGSLRDRTIEIANIPPAVDAEMLNGCRDLVRVATVAEVFRLALHWFTGWEHLGCVDLDKSAFFGSLDAAAYVVDRPKAWLEAGAPVPVPAYAPEAELAVFLAWEGCVAFNRVNRGYDLVEARFPSADLSGGLYPGNEGDIERCLVGVGRTARTATRGADHG